MEETLSKIFDLQLEIGQQNLMISKQILEILSAKPENDGQLSLQDILMNIDSRLYRIECTLSIASQSMFPESLSEKIQQINQPEAEVLTMQSNLQENNLVGMDLSLSKTVELDAEDTDDV